MEWSDIKVFLQVVRGGTMTEATASLRMDHSTISRRIARLEREAGVPLFERAGRRLSITPEGARMAEAAEKLESIILREVMSLSESRAMISGKVRIGCTEEFGAHYLAPRLSSIAAQHPELDIELVALPRSFSLATREVDVVVTMDRPDSGDIRFKKLTSFAYGLYGASSYFGDRPRPLRVSDLSGDTWCGSIRELLHTSELDLGAIDDATLKPRFRTTSVTAQLATVLSGSAIAVLPCFVAADHPQLERLLAAQVSPLRNYWIAVHDDLAQSPRVRFVMDGIGKVVAQDRGRFLAKEPDRAAAEMSAEEQEAAVIGSIARLITIPHREIEVQRGV